MRFLKIITIVTAFLLSVECPAQQRFQEYIYDNINPFNFECHQLNVTSDSGFIFNGFLNSFGGFLLKTDQQGNVQWYRSYSGLNNIYDAEETPDHGFVIIGDNPLFKLMVMKVDSIGNIQWSKARNAFGVPGGCAHGLPDGGYVFTGLPDIFVARTNAAGTILWEKTYSFHSEAYHSRFLQITPDGGFIMCGTLHQQQGIGLVKLDSLGNIQWEKSIAPGSTRGISVCPAGSGYFLTAEGPNEHLVMLTDSVGNVRWAKQWPIAYDTTNTLAEPPYLVVPDGNELLCYGTRFFPNQNKTHIFRLDTAGNVLWSRYYGTAQTDYEDEPGSCVRTYGNGLAFTIRMQIGSGIFVMSLDSSGVASCNDNPAVFSPAAYGVFYGTSSLTVQPSGITYNNPTLPSASRNALIQYECTPLSGETIFGNKAIELYPNPADEKITLQFPFIPENGTLTLLDISGRVVMRMAVDHETNVEMSTQNLSPGFYSWQYVEHENVVTGKFGVQH